MPHFQLYFLSFLIFNFSTNIFSIFAFSILCSLFCSDVYSQDNLFKYNKYYDSKLKIINTNNQKENILKYVEYVNILVWRLLTWERQKIAIPDAVYDIGRAY